jgi:uncharacterized protein (DUF1800 family)
MPILSKKNTILGYQNAFHLLKRTSFSINKELVTTFANKTPDEALSTLFNYHFSQDTTPLSTNGETYIPTISNIAITNSYNFSSISHQRYWWLQQFINNKNIQYKLSLLLHTFFPTEDFIGEFWTSFDYLELLRFHTKTSFKDLAIRMTKNIRMLYYLDNRLNNKEQPNENYAREFLELFTIGKGTQIATGDYTTYTEEDVQQAARVFTGFTGTHGDKYSRLSTYDPSTLIPEGFIDVSVHDTSNKTFSAAFNHTVIQGGTTEAEIQQELEDFVSMVFNQLATAKNYARRLYRFFVSREITQNIEDGVISPLAQTLYDHNYNIQIAITELLTSTHFYDEDDAVIENHVIGALVKSPLDLILQLYTIFEISLPDYTTNTQAAVIFIKESIYNDAASCGFKVLRPIDVNGYPAYNEAPLYDKLWATTANLKPRYDVIIDKLLDGYMVNSFLIHLDSASFVKNSGHFSTPEDASILLQDFYDLLFVHTSTGERYAYFEQALLGGLSAVNWQFEWQNYITFNDGSAVTIALNRLIKALVKSPEYQVM